jgi:hypothetical protein
VVVGDIGITEEGANFLEEAVIEAPAPGMLFMSGGASLGATTETVQCGFDVDGFALAPFLRDVAPAAGSSSCTAAISVYVDAGVHTVTFVVLIEEGVAWGAGTLSVIWIPFDGFGAVPESDFG